MEQTPRPSFAESTPNPRLSSSPAGTPRLVSAPESPTHSIHANMESIHDQPDQGLRTADFFDDTSDDDTSAKETNYSPNRKSAESRPDTSPPKSPRAYLGGTDGAGEFVTKCADDPDPFLDGGREENRKSSPVISGQGGLLGMDGYLKLTQTPGPNQKLHWPGAANASNSSLTPAAAPPPHRPPRPESGALGSDGFGDTDDVTPVLAQARPLSFQRTDSAGRVVTIPAALAAGVPAIVEPSAEESTPSATAVEAAKDELIIALLREDGASQASSQRIPFVANPDQRPDHTGTMKKRVSLAPPPLEIGLGHLPDNIVRTPYPQSFRRSYIRPSPLRTSIIASGEHETVLPLSISRCGSHAHRPQKISHITLPANLDAPGTVDMTAASPKAKEQHFEALDFDDAHLFQLLRAEYKKLSGPLRFLSARSLQNIQLAHSLGCPFDGISKASCKTAFTPQSPRYLTSRGLTDTFSDAELIKYYRTPKLGKSRYAWVHWAKRLSSSMPHLESPAPDPPADSPAARLKFERVKIEKEAEEASMLLMVSGECVTSLEFVEGWCWARILLAVAAVKIFALAAALCWIFLGVGVQEYPTGYREAGSRIEGGIMLGVFTLLIGWTSVAGWLALSWLIE